MLKTTSLNCAKIFSFIFATLIIFISISIPVNAGTPIVSVSASFSSQVSPGSSSQLDVIVSEIGGEDWIKDATVQISVSPSDGVYLSKIEASVARIEKLSSAQFTFPVQVLETAPPGDKTIHITVQYYEMDLFNIDTYGPYYVTGSKTFYVNNPYGSISISSNPDGTKVYLDEMYKGTTPITLNDVPIGSHTITLTKSGYNDVTKVLTVNSGQASYISESLDLTEVPTEVHVVKATEAPAEVATEARAVRTSTVPPKTTTIPVISVILFSLFGLALFAVIRKKPTNSVVDVVSEVSSKTTKPSAKSTVPVNNINAKKEDSIKTSSAFSYKGAKIQYKIKVENPTSEPIGDINVTLYVPDVFLLSKSTISITMLKPGESKTVTFEIRPTGECGDCEVSGKVVYYDYSNKKTSEIDIPSKSLSIVCPILKVKEISISQWHNIISKLIETEESTREIDMPAETLFAMASRIVKDMHMHSLEPEITQSPQLFNGVARFYGEGVKDLKYAAQIEVVGGAKRSKLIIKTWAEREDALTGFYHGMLDELEKRIHVKGFIDDSIVQNFYHYGDNIGTQITDSFVYKSNVGTDDAKICLQCGKKRVGGEEFCSGCGMKFG